MRDHAVYAALVLGSFGAGVLLIVTGWTNARIRQRGLAAGHDFLSRAARVTGVVRNVLGRAERVDTGRYVVHQRWDYAVVDYPGPGGESLRNEVEVGIRPGTVAVGQQVGVLVDPWCPARVRLAAPPAIWPHSLPLAFAGWPLVALGAATLVGAVAFGVGGMMLG